MNDLIGQDAASLFAGILFVLTSEALQFFAEVSLWDFLSGTEWTPLFANAKFGILPLEGFHLSRSLRKAMRRNGWVVRVDTDFPAVIEACASVGEDRDTTWINGTIRRVYGQLFDQGVAHTVEVWHGDDLVGGLFMLHGEA